MIRSDQSSRVDGLAAPAAILTIARARVLLLRLAPALSGVLIGAAFLDFRLHLIAWVAFAPLFWALHEARNRRETIVTAAIAGVITNILGFYWLIYTINVFGNFPYPIAVLFYACLTTYSSLQFVLFGLAFRRTGWGPLGIAPALAWTALEFLYPSLFPWRMAHTQYLVVPLIQIGDVTGPYGLSLVVVWVSAAVAMTLSESGWRRIAPLGCVIAAVGALYTYGLVRIPAIAAAIAAAPQVNVALVQGNVGIKEKGDLRYFDVNVDRYRDLTSRVQARAALAVWPETVVQEWLPASVGVLDGSDHPFPGLRTLLIYGGLAFQPTGAQEADEYNSAFLIDGRGSVLARYDKQILMPFGEYLPFASWIPGIKKLSPHTSGFTPGTTSHTFDVPGVGRVGPLICFEDIAASIPRAMTNAGAELLIAMANDAWYGESAAPYEHQALALWRAVENRRYLLRVNNSGVTGVVDPFGRVIAELPIFTADALVAAVHPVQIRSVYTRLGDAFGWIVVVTCLAMLTRRSTRQS